MRPVPPAKAETATAIAGQPVTLAALLAARDLRAARQRALLAGFGLPVVSATVVMPGPVKDSPLSRTLLDAAIGALDQLFDGRGWTVRLSQRFDAPTGPESLYVTEAEAEALKRALTDLEDAHPLGRLWDLDVLRPDRQPALSRREIGRAPRRCLVCGDQAHVCGRAQRHSLDALLAAIQDIADAYFRSPPG